MPSFAQQKGTVASGTKADNDSLAAWYEKTLQLGGVVVTGRAADKKVTVEKTSITPAASVSAATGSVLEVIRSSSAVTVDGSGQVSIRGNSNVLILVDGVPTTLDGLGSIPAANVQSIDIVTSPDAKYDAEGSGGIISIVSKKQTPEAFTAMASANYGINNFVNGNVAMSYNFGRWGLRLNYNGKWERDHVESELHRRIVQTGSTLDQLIDAAKKTTGQNIGLSVSYKATKRDVLTLDVKAGFPRMNNLQTMHNRYGIAGIASEKLRQTDITFNREMVEGSLGYRHLVGRSASWRRCRPSTGIDHRTTTNSWQRQVLLRWCSAPSRAVIRASLPCSSTTWLH